MVVSTCFDKLEIVVNLAMLEVMQSHLMHREGTGNIRGNTSFDCWVHGQICRSEFNKL